MTGMAELGWTGRREYDFFDAKGVVEALMGDLGVEWSLGEPVGSPLHPSRSAFVMVGGERAGVVGEIHPRVARSLDVPGRIAMAEIELAALIAHASSTIAVRDVPRFPPVRRDLSFALDEGVASGEVLGAIRAAGGDLVAACELFDVWSGPPLEAGKKSLSFALDLRASERTLESQEADEAVERIVSHIRERFGGEIRSASV